MLESKRWESLLRDLHVAHPRAIVTREEVEHILKGGWLARVMHQHRASIADEFFLQDVEDTVIASKYRVTVYIVWGCIQEAALHLYMLYEAISAGFVELDVTRGCPVVSLDAPISTAIVAGICTPYDEGVALNQKGLTFRNLEEECGVLEGIYGSSLVHLSKRQQLDLCEICRMVHELCGCLCTKGLGTRGVNVESERDKALERIVAALKKKGILDEVYALCTEAYLSFDQFVDLMQLKDEAVSD